ncbi:hypothetical protein [Kitasatospora sp. NPDC057223]|uniref:hypothetical protein n=1 Tax=Kitasatospora sp. NPDC057223 TaxID=3346055 RepID=UPI003634802C
MSDDNHALVARTEQNSPAAQVELLGTPPDARDITAELAAPPRRKLPWLSLALAGGVLAAAAFSGGVWYQQNHGTTKQAAPGGNQQRTGGLAGAPGGYGGQAAAGAAGGYGGAAAGTGTRRGTGQAGGTGQAAGGAGAPAGGTTGQAAGGGFTRGTVKVVDGTTVYLTDAAGNTIKVTTGDSTKVQLNKEGKVGDLQPGQSVTVVGTPDASGGYAASQLVEGAAAAGGFGTAARSSSGG